LRTVTIIAAIAAAATAVLGYAIISNTTDAFVGGFNWSSSGQGTDQRQNVTIGTNPSNSSYPQVNVTVNGVKLVADIADNNNLRSKGLSVKDTLNETEGMLFVFSTAREHSFWMNGMKFPIDIIWINEDHEVVHIEHSLEVCIPDEHCPTYKPDRDSLYVLETVAGFAQKYNVTRNTYVDFKLPSA
jgi:uncharacterized membrane protein (UPF0127 family)